MSGTSARRKSPNGLPQRLQRSSSTTTRFSGPSDAYDACRRTADSVIQTVQPRPSGVRILSPEDQDAYFETPAYRQLVKFIASLTLDERIDLKALAWYGRQVSQGSSWGYLLNHASIGVAK